MVHVVDNIPGAVNIRISELISVIPVFYHFIFVIQSIIRKQFSDLTIRKAEVRITVAVCDGENLHIIQAGKNAFFCDPQTAGQNRKI